MASHRPGIARERVALLFASAALLGFGPGAASAAGAPAPAGSTPCVFWGEAHACQSTDPHVTLEVINQHETSQCTFHENWTWGDGTAGEEAALRGSIEGSNQLLGRHTYAHPGTYKIAVTGYVLSEEAGLDFVCEAPPVEYTFTLLPGAAVLGVQESSTPPVVSGLTQSHREWRAGQALARLARSARRPPAPVGTTFSFNLNEQASVKLSFLREAVGRRSGSRCVPATRKNRRRARCRLSSPAGGLTFTARPGQNTAYFQGRISVSQALTPASYGLTVTATNAAGQRSAPRSLHFTVLK